jgi:hypothetical protein
MAQTGKLGTADSRLGDMLLAFAGADAPRPSTGSITGRLGTSDSMLGNVRLALGETEGGGGGGIIYVAAASDLALSGEAVLAGIGRGCTASNTLDLLVTAGRNNLPGGAAESAIDLGASADLVVARAVDAATDIALLDAAARNNLPSVDAQSTISLNTTAGLNIARVVAASSVLELTDQAEGTGRNIVQAAAESAIDLAVTADFKAAWAVAGSSVLDLMGEAGRNQLVAVEAESTISLTAEAGRNELIAVDAESTISLGASAAAGLARAVAAGSELSLTDEATAIVLVPTMADAWDWVPLWATADVVVVRALAAQSALALSQAAPVGRPWRVAAASVLQTLTQEYDPQADEIVTRIDGLQDAASAARPLSATVRQAIPLYQSAAVVRVKAAAIDVSAESVLELLGDIRKNETGAARDWLVFGQVATVDPCKPASSELDLSSTAAVLVSVPRGAGSALALRQAAAYSIVFGGVLQKYHPFVGAGDSESPTPPPAALPEGTVASFQLFYPAEGVVTDSVTLRAPNLGNKDRLSFNRILRETRGGTLIVFADPIWPKIQTVVLTFSGLRSAQAQQLLAFLDAHLGEEVGLLDWEGRCWNGVITTPTDPVVQDGRDSFSASLEFEGELAPA